MVAGLFPSQKPGPGRLVATVSTPDVAGRKPRRAAATGAVACGVAADPAAPQPVTPASRIRIPVA
jgi:hypothetical protein